MKFQLKTVIKFDNFLMIESFIERLRASDECVLQNDSFTINSWDEAN